MFNMTSRLDRQTRQLNLGGAGGLGGKGTEYLLIGALAVVIVGSLILTFYFGMGGSTGPNNPPKPMYKCRVCGEESEIDPRTLFPEGSEPEMGPAGPIDRRFNHPDCPKCGAKEGCDRMIRCFECGKYFVSPRLDWDEMTDMGTPPAGAPPANICPHCGTDQDKWYREHRIGKKK